MTWARQTGIFALGDLPTQSGEILRDARLSWKSHGTLAPTRDNVIVYPTSFSAKHTDIEWLIGPDGVLDPTRWFIVIPDMFANGLSSSPSNTQDYPALVSARDNVLAQRRLLSEQFGVEKIACAYGWSMGAQQAYHWAALFPDAVARAVIVCGSARTAVHNNVFLAGLAAILEAAPEHLGGGRFSAPPRQALRAFARIYAGWALSQDFYRANLHLTNAPSLETFLQTQWEARYYALHAADLYAQIRTWQNGDIAGGGDLAAALSAIKARVLLMPGSTDLYFRVADNSAELPLLRSGELSPIPSIFGHRAGNPNGIPDDFEFLKTKVRQFLEDR